jgi:hypothetical protein
VAGRGVGLCLGLVCLGLVCLGLVCLGLVCLGLVCLGLVCLQLGTSTHTPVTHHVTTHLPLLGMYVCLSDAPPGLWEWRPVDDLHLEEWAGVRPALQVCRRVY